MMETRKRSGRVRGSSLREGVCIWRLMRVSNGKDVVSSTNPTMYGKWESELPLL